MWWLSGVLFWPVMDWRLLGRLVLVVGRLLIDWRWLMDCLEEILARELGRLVLGSRLGGRATWDSRRGLVCSLGWKPNDNRLAGRSVVVLLLLLLL